MYDALRLSNGTLQSLPWNPSLQFEVGLQQEDPWSTVSPRGNVAADLRDGEWD